MKKNILIFSILVFIIFLISCEQKIEKPPEELISEEPPVNVGVNIECNTNADCATGGCSGQVCGSKEKVKGIITTCEYREEYGCLRLTSCGCVNNKCNWEENNAYRKCISEVGGLM